MVRNNESFIRGMEAITLAGAIALGTAACSSAEADKPTTTIEQTIPADGTEIPTTTDRPSLDPASPDVPGITEPTESASIEATEGESEKETIGTKEVLSPVQLVELYKNDPISFKNYFTVSIEDVEMTETQIRENPQEFAKRFAEIMVLLDEQVFLLPNGMTNEAATMTEEEFMRYAKEICEAASGHSDKDLVNPQHNGWHYNWQILEFPAGYVQIMGENNSSQPVASVNEEVVGINNVTVDGQGRVRMEIEVTGEIQLEPVSGIRPKDLSGTIVTHLLGVDGEGKLEIGSVEE